MAVFLLLIVCLAVFPLQLWLCFSEKKLWIRLTPVCFVVVYLLVSVLLALSPKWFGAAPDTGLVGVFLLMIGLFLGASVAFCWVSWAVVQFVQKRRK